VRETERTRGKQEKCCCWDPH